MLRRKQKSGKRLAKTVLAALLCAGGLHGIVLPAAAEAADPITVTGISGTGHPYEIIADGGKMTGTKFEEDYYVYHPSDASVTTLTLAYTAVPESDEAQKLSYDGAYSETGDVTGHTVNVSGENTRYWSAAGGESADGTSTRNRVIVSGGKGYYVFGGYPDTGNATYNTVTVSDGYVLNGVYAGFVYDGDGIASGNKVEISGGEAAVESDAEFGYAVVVGGSSYKAAENNEVMISGGTVGNQDYLSGGEAAPAYIVAGGDSVNGSTGNTVTIKGNATVYANAVIGGFTGYGELGDITSEERVGNIVAGGDASGNRVSVEANAGSIERVYGGLAFGGNATGNTVTLKGGAFEKVYGGLAVSANPDDGEGSGTAASTPVMGNADNNTVNFSGTAQAVFIYGGAGFPGPDANPESIKTGTANNNTVNISGGSVLNRVYGGVTNSEEDIASGNKVEISGGEAAVENFADYGSEGYARVIGGAAYSGAEKNEVTISGGTVGNQDYLSGGEAASAYIVAGGDSVNGSTGNTVTIKGNATVYANAVIGGFTGFGELGDIAGGEYIDKIGAGGDASGNQVSVEANAGSIESVYGGLAFGGNATENTVTLDGGSFEEAYGGLAVSANPGDGEDSGTAASTPVMGNADNNTVNFSGTAQAVFIYGGAAFTNTDAEPGSLEVGTANNNTVNISGGTLGGTTTVDVDNGSEGKESYTGYIAGDVFGGISSGEASGNTVTISGGDLNMATVFGGYVQNSLGYTPSPRVNNNTVNILAPVKTGALIGGFIMDSDLKANYSGGSGNTLNVAAKDVTTVFAAGFQNMNFYLPKDVANGDTMLTIRTPKTTDEFPEAVSEWVVDKYKFQEDGTLSEDEEGNILSPANPTDLTNVTFGVAALQGVTLKKGDKVTLITDENGLKTDAELKTASAGELAKAEFLAAHDMSTDDQYGLSISKLGDNAVIATVDSKTPKNNEDRAKSPAETRESVVTLVNAGADLLAGQGMSNAADAAAAENASDGGPAASGGGGFAPFAAVSGSSLRAETGSHVNTKGIGLALGFAREIENSSGKLLIGPVVEYGHGRYDSYQDDGSKADGKAHYWGVGVIAKQTNDNGMYYEGSLRVGRTGSDYNRNDPGAGRMSYDSDATYWGAHLGIGKIQDIGHKNTLDFYGKYFYSHTGGDSTVIHTTGLGPINARFGSVDSHRLRVGARVTHELNEKNKIYGGLAYQYEFKGDARVTYNNGGGSPSPSVKGSSGLIELGWQVKPGRSPMVIDLGVTGWVGRQRGVTANLQAVWTF